MGKRLSLFSGENKKHMVYSDTLDHILMKKSERRMGYKRNVQYMFRSCIRIFNTRMLYSPKQWEVNVVDYSRETIDLSLIRSKSYSKIPN